MVRLALVGYPSLGLQVWVADGVVAECVSLRPAIHERVPPDLPAQEVLPSEGKSMLKDPGYRRC